MENAATTEGSGAAGPAPSASALSRPRLLWIGLAGLLLLVAACWAMQHRELPTWAAVALGLGLAAWIAVSWMSAGRREDLEPIRPSTVSAGRLAAGLALCLGLAALSWHETAGGQFRPLGTFAWLAAIGIWFLAWWPARADTPAEPRGGPAPRRLWIFLALLALMTIGGVFRFYLLSEIPPQPLSDHAEDLKNIVVLEQGDRPVFFPRNTGQAPLPFYWEFSLRRALDMPLDFLALKTSTAIIGMLAIPAMYFAAAELGGAPLGLAAAALTAWSKWPTFGARRGLTFAWAVFPAALALWALLRYMRRGGRKSALWAGFWIGFGQFGYNAFKIVPALVPLAFGFLLFDRRWKGRRRRLLADGLLVTATALLVFLPLLQYTLQHPQDFWRRAMTRAGSEERALPGTPGALFAGNLKAMALAFHWQGDTAWVNTLRNEPFLDPVTGALLLAGVVIAVTRAVRGSPRWAVVLVSIFFLTLASTLALAFPIENPGINRAAVAIPSVFALAALPAAWLFAEARQRKLATPLAIAAALAVLAALSIQQNFDAYFVRFRAEQTIIMEPTMDLLRVMRERRESDGVPYDNAYLLNWRDWIDGAALGFELGDQLWADPHDLAPDRPVPRIHDRPLLFFVHRDDLTRRQRLREMYPGGEERLEKQPFKDRDYYTYFVPR